MIRVGILGSDNSHAMAFSKLCNIPMADGTYRYEDLRVVGICGCGEGQDPVTTQKVFTDGKLEFIAEKPEDFFGKVDAVMVVHRHGNLHAKFALPFIEAGIPTWIDKPFTIKIEDAKSLFAAAEKKGSLLTGGSCVKYAGGVLELKEKIDSASFGAVMGGAMNFPAEKNSVYGGIFFYGPHLCEMMLGTFGYDVKSVSTVDSNTGFTAIAKYDDFNVSMAFNAKGSGKYLATVYMEKGTESANIDLSDIYMRGFNKFYDMIKTGVMPQSFDNLIKATVLLTAIDKSLNDNGREVLLSEIY